ncbi:MAG: Mpo1-like protein [Gemmatimonadales bacterium]
MTEFKRFSDFYPYYLAEHQNRVSRRLHVTGTALVLLTLVAAVVTGRWLLLLAMPLFGYGFAWLGHFVFERNRPATFRHPLYSLLGDFALFRDVITGRIPF